MNAPRWWPKSSDSASSREMVAALMATNGLRRARALVVERARDEVLSGAGLPADQDRQPQRGDPANRGGELEHRRGPPDDAGKRDPIAERGLAGGIDADDGAPELEPGADADGGLIDARAREGDPVARAEIGHLEPSAAVGDAAVASAHGAVGEDDGEADAAADVDRVAGAERNRDRRAPARRLEMQEHRAERGSI